MTNDELSKLTNKPIASHTDVLIIGAGIAGIGGAYHLTKQCCDKSFVVLEAQRSFGGTWRTHRYPGVRSDSDLYTFGYRFKPWVGKPIATADEILTYMGDVINENNLDQNIRYQHKVLSATWSSEENLWTLEVIRMDTEEKVYFTTNFLWMCQGYYRHSEGYTPNWKGIEQFKGQILHPQTWPERLDIEGKNVVVIGSGATAATLVPAIANKCNHVTMLQRSPSYYKTSINKNQLADELRELEIEEKWIHEIVRRKIFRDYSAYTRRALAEPESVRMELLKEARDYLGPDFDIETHFSPKYDPWRQRLAVIPDGDLYQKICEGCASVVTDNIESFIENGILTKSGKILEADIIVSATGFNLNVLGDIDFVIDGKPLIFSDTVTYRGIMFTGVPNMALVFGYLRSAWTLRSELVADFVCRLINHMKSIGKKRVVPTLRPEDEKMELLPWISPDEFNPGYLKRGVHLMPKRGNKPEWQFIQDYWIEKVELPEVNFNESVFVYE